MRCIKATEDDIFDICRLLIKRESEAIDVPDEMKISVEKLLLELKIRLQEAPTFILVHNKKIVGLMGLSLDGYFWSEKKYLCPYAYYVLPEHRSLDTIKLLFLKATEYADSVCLPLHVYDVAFDRLKARRRLLSLIGFKECGLLFKR